MKQNTQPKKVKQPEVSLELPQAEFLPDTVYDIELSRITPSPFEPQERRRKRFKDTDLDALGDSLAKKQIHPVLLRRVFVDNKINKKISPHGSFEIVAGERRFLASVRKNLATIKAIVEDFSDLETVEMQYQENHQRIDNNPLDDAFTFKYLQEKENLSVSQLADRFNLGKTTVAERLELNKLIPEAVAQLEDEKLPLKHAYYLAKFPQKTQKEIVENSLAFRSGDVEDGALPFEEFKTEVETEILRKLETAPFDTEDARLHIKGLICADCPERSGFLPLLFPDLKADDSCLNKSCFEQKTNINLRLKREEIAEIIQKSEALPIEKALEKVPLVTARGWAEKSDSPFNQKILTSQNFLEKPECAASEPALIVKGDRKGETTFICQDKSCPKHHAQSKKPDKIKVKKLSEYQALQLENDFNLKVAQEVRNRIFAGGMKYFTDTKVFWQFTDLICKLIAEFLATCGLIYKENIFQQIKDWKNVPKDLSGKEKNLEFLLTLDKEKLSQILFLLSHKEELDAGYIDSAKDENVRKVCSDYTKLDYRLLDAEIRLELAPDEFKQIADQYYHAVFTKEKNAEIPRFWLIVNDE